MFVARLPYFMTNKEWYYFDKKELCIKLTDKATEKAKKSYADFQANYEADNGKG